MEYSENEPSTPRFGYNIDNKTSVEGFLSKRVKKASSSSTKYEVNKDNKEKSKSKEGNKKNRKEKSKSKNKEDNKNKHKTSKSKNKNISEEPEPIGQKYENPYDNFLKKRIKLRNDFDQSNSEKFLFEKELAFQQFGINEDADYLEN